MERIEVSEDVYKKIVDMIENPKETPEQVLDRLEKHRKIWREMVKADDAEKMKYTPDDRFTL